jgi:histidinol dehydrogenase
MKTRNFAWSEGSAVAAEIRAWMRESAAAVDVAPIAHEVRERGDAAVLDLTERFDGARPDRLRVEAGEIGAAAEALDGEVRAAIAVAVRNVMRVAREQIAADPGTLTLEEGQTVSLRDVAVGAAGIYVPGGRAAYPSTVLMCCIPASLAGVERIAVASPPGAGGAVNPVVLAACEACGVEEVYAMGGAQAVFALAYGTETVPPVDVIAGPGNSWVQEAKRSVFGVVGIDSIAGPSELMVVVGHDTELEWAALDLCAQAEHGAESPLIAVAVEEAILERLRETTVALAAERPSVTDASLALVQVPDLGDAVALANAFAPEHLQLMSEDAGPLAGRVTTAGCVFTGPFSGTAFGDYAAGSNHVLPTGGAGRFLGPLGPGVFRRRIANVSLRGPAAAALAPSVDVLARVEGLPVHGESARVRIGSKREGLR